MARRKLTSTLISLNFSTNYSYCGSKSPDNGLSLPSTESREIFGVVLLKESGFHPFFTQLYLLLHNRYAYISSLYI